MSKRLAWLLGVVGLVSAGLLVACGTKYNASSDGLVLVGSQGSGLIETFSFNVGNGKVSAVDNTPADTANKTCVLNGVPSSLVMDPAGAFAYAIINTNPACSGSTNGILAFKVNSNGTTTSVGSQVSFRAGSAGDVVPVTMVMDPAGKFLFVADRGSAVPGSVSVFAIGSGGTVTEVAGSPFYMPPPLLPQSNIDIVSVAVTPTV